MQIDDSLKKFLSSPYGRKIIATAKLYGQENYKYGKKFYPIKELEMWAKVFEEQNRK